MPAHATIYVMRHSRKKWIQCFLVEDVYNWPYRLVALSWTPIYVPYHFIYLNPIFTWAAVAWEVWYGVHIVVPLMATGVTYPGIILYMRPAIGGRRYIVTPSPIGWAHTQNDTCIPYWDAPCIEFYVHPSVNICCGQGECDIWDVCAKINYLGKLIFLERFKRSIHMGTQDIFYLIVAQWHYITS